MVGAFVASAKNSLLRRGGCSPNMHVFGREPWVPGALLSDPDSPHVQEAATLDEELQRAFRIRAAAAKAFIDYENDEHLRRAMLRQGRPWRGPIEPGMRVAFWRFQRPGREAIGRRPQPGYELGTVITVDPRPSGNVWIRSDRSGQVIECAREQVRSAVGFELWSPSPDDIKHLRRAEKDLAEARAEAERLPEAVVPSPEEDVGAALLPPLPVAEPPLAKRQRKAQSTTGRLPAILEDTTVDPLPLPDLTTDRHASPSARFFAQCFFQPSCPGVPINAPDGTVPGHGREA